MLRYRYIVFLLLISFYSCDYLSLKEKEHESIVASVGNIHLYKKDLVDLYEADMSVDDSLVITNNFIENWARKQIILQKATFNISDKKKSELEKMIKSYEEDLYINSYKDALVSQNLDTIINSEEIKEFYIANQNIFRLKEEIFQYKYLCFSTELADKNKLKKQFISFNVREIDSILLNDLKYATGYLNDSTWVSYKDLTKKIPIIKSINKKRVLLKNHFIELQDSLKTHFIGIKDFKTKNEIAPIEYVEPVIRQMILHKNKLSYINKLDNELIEEAIKNNTFKKY